MDGIFYLDAPLDGSVAGESDELYYSIDYTIPRDVSSMMLSFVGTEGKLYMNNDDGEWHYWRLEDGEHVEQPLNGIEDAWTWDNDYKGSFTNAAQHIEELLHGTATNRSPGCDAIRSLEIIVAFYLSHYTGSQIDIPLAGPVRHTTIMSW